MSVTVFDSALVIGSLVVCLLFINISHPFLLRHIFLAYSFSIYNIAPLILSEEEVDRYLWSVEFIAIATLFMVGYYLGLRVVRRRQIVEAAKISADMALEWKERVLRNSILVLLCGNVIVLLWNVKVFGLHGFYEGAMLAEAVKSYGHLDPSGAITQVMSFVFGSLTLVCLSVLVERMARRQNLGRARVYYRGLTTKKRQVLLLSLISLVFLPVFQLSRSGVVFGILTYLVIRSKISKGIVALGPVILLGMMFGIFVYIGLVRDQALGGVGRIETIFASELTPWMAYREIRSNIDLLDYQYGKTLIIPFVLKVVPRGLFPDKPYNSSGYYMSVLRPKQFEAGYSLAPTYMGDLFLNLGWPGVLVGTVFLGIFSGRIDRIVLCRQMNKLGLFVVVFASYFALLRNNLSDSIFIIAVNLLLYLVISRWASSYRAVQWLRWRPGTSESNA